MNQDTPPRLDALPTLAGRRSVPASAAPSAASGAGRRARHRQNGAGDVVIPVAHGEVVALPRLWTFDLTELGEEAGVLRTDTGLTAVIALTGDTAVVTEVTEAGIHAVSA